MLRKSFVYILFIGLSFGSLFSQGEDEVQDILTRYKNYRFGSIYIYKVKKSKEIEQMRAEERAAEEGVVKIDKTIIESLEAKHEEGAINLIKQFVNDELEIPDIEKEMVRKGFKGFPKADIEQLYNYYKQLLEGGGTSLRTVVYLITMPPNKGEKPTDIIGMVISEFPKAKAKSMDMKKQLKRVSLDKTYSAKGMKNKEFDNPADYNGYNDLFQLATAYIKQNNIENVTLEALALESDFWTGKTVGVSKPLIVGNSISERDIQLFRRISYGDPIESFGNAYELEVGFDKIRFTKYKQFFTKKKSTRKNRRNRGKPAVEDKTTITTKKSEPVADMTISNNSSLPKFGVELKYGIDDINMPSLWSERSTLSVFWEQAKFGMILPLGDITALSKGSNLFNQERKFTSAGVGFAGELDFGFPLIKNSNVFNLSFGYVFGDAKEALFQERKPTSIIGFQDNNTDYLVRANARLLYTTGIAIDSDYLLRFGIGGAFYNVESWNWENDETINNGEENVVFKKSNSDAIGNFVIKVDFVSKNSSTPYGANLNYFDGTLQINGFVIFPVIDNTFFIKVNARGNTILRDDLNPWEVNGLFQPDINFSYRF